MIVVDTSIWIDHLRMADLSLARLLNRSQVLGHAFVTGEIALGVLRQRDLVVGLLSALPQAKLAEHTEVMVLIERHKLAGTGIGYVDAHLLCATKLTPNARLWTRDKRLSAAARTLAIEHMESATP